MAAIGIISGGFDPLHSGHIELIRSARKRCVVLIVALNSDDWLVRKKGKYFMPWEERAAILKGIKGVHEVIAFDDSDGTAIDAIRKVKKMYPTEKLAFFNGGDRTQDNIPEMTETYCEFIFGVGGTDKKNSSSWILNNWTNPVTSRPWGQYKVLFTEGHHTKVKELICQPGKSLSMQRHEHRGEIWYVSSGRGCVELENITVELEHQDYIVIEPMQWHRLYNPYNEPVKILEIQYGNRCDEEDIERRET